MIVLVNWYLHIITVFCGRGECIANVNCELEKLQLFLIHVWANKVYDECFNPLIKQDRLAQPSKSSYTTCFFQAINFAKLRSEIAIFLLVLSR